MTTKERVIQYGNFRRVERLCDYCNDWFVWGCGGGEYLECPECCD